jgi:hypothetical protein
MLGRGLLPRAITAGVVVALAGSVAQAANAQSSAWSDMAEQDLAAAYRLLRELHPGAVEETRDRGFVEALETGRDEALKIARQARTYGAYRAALQRFAAQFKDQHIASAALFPVPQRWPGFIVAESGGSWRVIARSDESAPAIGSRLRSCDGQTPQSLSALRLAPFTSDWSVKAQRVWASARLLIDSGNPVHPPLEQCEFEAPGGSTARHRLDWRKLEPADWRRHIDEAMPIAPEEVYLRPFHDGYWIRLGTLSGKAYPIVRQAEGQEAALRNSPFVVVDLRSNAGGASVFTDKLARVIYGRRALQAARKKGELGPNLMIWRATASTRDEADSYFKRFAPVAPPDDPYLLGLGAQRDAIAKAMEAGSALAPGPIEVHPPGGPAKDEVRKPPKVILITDRYCFSSCLLGVKLFRDLGAVHVGEETNANTHYSSLKTVDLPSGLSTFSTLQAYMAAIPRQVGPFTPAVPLSDLADDGLLQQKVRDTLAKQGIRTAGPASRP